VGDVCNTGRHPCIYPYTPSFIFLAESDYLVASFSGTAWGLGEDVEIFYNGISSADSCSKHRIPHVNFVTSAFRPFQSGALRLSSPWTDHPNTRTDHQKLSQVLKLLFNPTEGVPQTGQPEWMKKSGAFTEKGIFALHF